MRTNPYSNEFGHVHLTITELERIKAFVSPEAYAVDRITVETRSVHIILVRCVLVCGARVTCVGSADHQLIREFETVWIHDKSKD